VPKRSGGGGGGGAKAASMSMDEIESLPPAKRRKSAKARGASGPGRGWRKGLKM
jgi:hypothetical protein